MMAKNIEITLIAAHDIKNGDVKNIRASAAAWITNDPNNNNSKQRTPVDTTNGSNPMWNHVMTFTLDKAALKQEGLLILEIAIYTETTSGEEEIGRISLPLMGFLQSVRSQFGGKPVSCQIRNQSGEPEGNLDMSVKMDFSLKRFLKNLSKKKAVHGGLLGAHLLVLAAPLL